MELRVTSSAVVIGTPDSIRVPKVLENLAIATFFKIGPKMGILSEKVSIFKRPSSD